MQKSAPNLKIHVVRKEYYVFKFVQNNTCVQTWLGIIHASCFGRQQVTWDIISRSLYSQNITSNGYCRTMAFLSSDNIYHQLLLKLQ